MQKRMRRAGKVLLAAVLAVVMSASSGTAGYAETVAGPGANLRPSTNGVTIYISKLGKTLTLKQNGVELGCYPVSTGAASAQGNKVSEGDCRTPSGEFYICTRNDKSSYYLSLGLSYPGIADAKRGYAEGIISESERDAIIKAINAGEQPPWNTALGGAIMIHGERKSGRGTLGCVSVDNEVMDQLWAYCNLGVPVTIGP